DRLEEGGLAGAVRSDDGDDALGRRNEAVLAVELLIVAEIELGRDHATASSVAPAASASRIASSSARRPRWRKAAAKAGSYSFSRSVTKASNISPISAEIGSPPRLKGARMSAGE